MKTILFPTLKLFVALTLFTGVLYPLAMTGVASALYPRAAGGSLIIDAAGNPRASTWVGQEFSKPGEFWGRLSQTAEAPYNGMAAGGSNLGTSNPGLAENASPRLQALATSAKVPVDLVTSSGSGLDPHISPEAALAQVERVSRATRQPPHVLHALVNRMTEPRTFGVLGQPRVNVVKLNISLKDLLKETL